MLTTPREVTDGVRIWAGFGGAEQDRPDSAARPSSIVLTTLEAMLAASRLGKTSTLASPDRRRIRHDALADIGSERGIAVHFAIRLEVGARMSYELQRLARRILKALSESSRAEIRMRDQRDLRRRGRSGGHAPAAMQTVMSASSSGEGSAVTWVSAMNSGRLRGDQQRQGGKPVRPLLQPDHLPDMPQVRVEAPFNAADHARRHRRAPVQRVAMAELVGADDGARRIRRHAEPAGLVVISRRHSRGSADRILADRSASKSLPGRIERP
jgi:hypothetical protein